MDVKIDLEDYNFKYRVCPVILKNDKVLFVEINNNGFLCCPGGHVEIGEDSISAVKRETEEEIGVKCENVKLIALIENFFKNKKGKQFHEVGMYYLFEDVEMPDEKLVDYEYIEIDHGQEVSLKFKWVGLDKLDDFDIRPLKLKGILKNKKFEFNHILVKE